MPFKDAERRREYDRERKRAWYAGLSGFEYNELLLKRRRTQAMHRRRQRRNQGV